MAEVQPHSPSVLTVRRGQPLIGVVRRESGQEFSSYFTDEKSADAALSADTAVAARSLAGAWSDLSWEEMEKALDRIRHESRPSPPLEL